MEIEDIARVAHEANRAYCITLGDMSQPSWDEAPEWVRKSILEGIKNIMLGLVITPAESHRLWMVHKHKEGWVYGEVKDPIKKTHPCMLPFNQLPEAQRVKDALFFNIVMALDRAGE